MRECTCLETHIPRNGHTLCRQNGDDYAFCKVCDDSFFVAHGATQCDCQLRTHRGIEQTVKTNSSVREFCAPPSKTADSKVVSVTRAEVALCQALSELIVEPNNPLALLLGPLSGLMFPDSRIA